MRRNNQRRLTAAVRLLLLDDAAGSVAVGSGSTSVVIKTTAVTANSQILLTWDASLGARLGVTCSSAPPSWYEVSARTAATSFTILLPTAPSGDACFSYLIVN